MTHNKHRKREIREEAKRTGRTYQQVLEDRWRPSDEIELQWRLAAAIRQTIKTWPSYFEADEEALDALVAQLVDVAIVRNNTVSATYCIELHADRSEGRRKTIRCMRTVSQFVCARLSLADEQEVYTKALTLAVAPIVVRRGPDYAIARDDALVANEVETWLSDCTENEWMCDSDD